MISNKADSPPHDDLLRIDLMMQLIHRSVVLHINRNLLARLAMQHRKRAPHFNGLRFAYTAATADTEESSDDAILVVLATEVVVQDGEERDGMDGHCCWCSATK